MPHQASNDTELVLQAVLQGRAIAQLSGDQVCEYLASEALVTTMAHFMTESHLLPQQAASSLAYSRLHPCAGPDCTA